MIIETTLNINLEILEQLNDAAGILNKSRTEVIIKVLKKVMAYDVDTPDIYRSITYQKSDNPDKWHRFHIRLKYYDYEFFLDLRKFLKASVSFLLAYGVKKYLHEIVHGINTDNNTYINYIFTRGMKNGYKYFQIIWGYPQNIEEFVPKIT